jgi:hypothetical protein
VQQLLQTTQGQQNLGQQLAAHNIKYVILAKDVDYRHYDFLQRQTDLRIIADYPDITLYKNTAWRKP